MRVCAWGLVVLGGMPFPICGWWKELQPLEPIHLPIDGEVWNEVCARHARQDMRLDVVRADRADAEPGDRVVRDRRGDDGRSWLKRGTVGKAGNRQGGSEATVGRR